MCNTTSQGKSESASLYLRNHGLECLLDILVLDDDDDDDEDDGQTMVEELAEA